MLSQAGYEFIIQSLESGCKDMAIKCQVLYGKASEFYDKDPVVTASIQDMQLFIRTIVKYRFPPPKKKKRQAHSSLPPFSSYNSFCRTEKPVSSTSFILHLYFRFHLPTVENIPLVR